MGIAAPHSLPETKARTLAGLPAVRNIMMKRLWLLIPLATCLPAVCFGGEAASAMPRGVVELFTSQGCSSCPQADKAFSRLANDPSVIALSFHVDYWNYLGWKDTMSSAENTRRQYEYAAAFGRSNVYTPQAVLNGRVHVKGGDLPAADMRFQSLTDERQGLDIPVKVVREDDCLDIDIGDGSGTASVVIAYFSRERQVRIDKGENAGKTITYRNVVQSVETIGMWEGKAIRLTLPLDVMTRDGHEGAAILVQSDGGKGKLGPIRGAALVPDAGT